MRERAIENMNQAMADSGVNGMLSAEDLAEHNAVQARAADRGGAGGDGPDLGLRAHRGG